MAHWEQLNYLFWRDFYILQAKSVKMDEKLLERPIEWTLAIGQLS
jgi:hypothetical protein